MKMHRMRCFGRTKESGNAALVVEESMWNEAERLKFAHRQEANATVFVDMNDAGDTQLDYYYPHARSSLCLHATLAASAVIFERRPDTRHLRFVTSMHRQVLEIDRDDNGIFVSVMPQACPRSAVDVVETVEFLRADPRALLSIRGPVSIGSPKLLVEVGSESVLNALRPNLKGIANWSREHGISGIYAYCHLRESIYAGRNFNHLDPQFEDAATGVAAGALALALERSITLLQGDLLGHPCTLLARYTDAAVQIGGRAVRNSI
ncbi:PhzF family phenazine biosynthesis protein [Paraburkholderia tropica]|uniref:PhzF family phenazine biosynthesis protein n=1 Tax=Paraburkholderia tropica TaxID=92647 RepID=UPI002ABE6AD5|nr:PhzF family phenazine biosynthesis protein [Paraburkholderia tropica]